MLSSGSDRNSRTLSETVLHIEICKIGCKLASAESDSPKTMGACATDSMLTYSVHSSECQFVLPVCPPPPPISLSFHISISHFSLISLLANTHAHATLRQTQAEWGGMGWGGS